jgi:Tol biopolymer transport system component
VPSPSGDLLVGFTTYKDEVDLALLNIPERRLLKNLTSGYTSRYEYPIVQSFTTGPVMGRDVAFAPNGDQVALFVKKERGRNLLLVNPLTGEITGSIPMDVEQQLSPAYSPDGRRIAFSGIRGNQSDIFIYDVDGGQITNITSDTFFDGSPVFSPDGKWLIYSSVGEEYAKLYRLNLADPNERYQITTGAWNDTDAYFSPDGKRLFFASDKQTGRNVEVAVNILQEAEDAARPEEGTPKPDPTNFAAYNIYSLDLETGDMLQYTDVVGGCFTPVVFTGENNKERMVFSSYYKGQWRLYSTPTDRPLHAAEKTTLASAPIKPEERSIFRPTSEFFLDEEKIENAGGFKLFIEDISVNAGVSSDQLFVSRTTIFMSDMLGGRRFIASLDSVASFSNFDFLYLDMRRRTSWGVRLFDNRSFFVTQDIQSGDIDRRQLYRETGLMGIVSYPFDRYHRIDGGLGYMSRNYYQPHFFEDPEGGPDFVAFERRSDKFPIISTTFSGDSAVWKFFGPVSGRRYQIGASYAPDTTDGGTLSADLSVDWREYFQISSRTLLATRLYGSFSQGNAPNFAYFGGLNTLRGYDFRTLIGQYAGFANVEFRFPLIDVLATPVIVLQQVRGALFFDIGAARFEDRPFEFRDDEGRLKDAKASVGLGISFNLLGMQLNWDFARRYDFKDLEKGYRTSFWIGQTF